MQLHRWLGTSGAGLSDSSFVFLHMFNAWISWFTNCGKSRFCKFGKHSNCHHFLFHVHTGTRSTSPHKTAFSLICQGQRPWISAMVLAVHLTWLAAVVFMIAKKRCHEIRSSVKHVGFWTLTLGEKMWLMMIFKSSFQFLEQYSWFCCRSGPLKVPGPSIRESHLPGDLKECMRPCAALWTNVES